MTLSARASTFRQDRQTGLLGGFQVDDELELFGCSTGRTPSVRFGLQVTKATGRLGWVSLQCS